MAAPQVALSRRAVAVEMQSMGLPLTVCFNPVMERLGQETVLMQESCLSVPGLVGGVKRAAKVAVTFEESGGGRRRRLVAEGFLAGLLQHELDHLDGVLYVDRVHDNLLAFTDEWWEHVEPRLTHLLCSEGRCSFD